MMTLGDVSTITMTCPSKIWLAATSALSVNLTSGNGLKPWPTMNSSTDLSDIGSPSIFTFSISFLILQQDRDLQHLPNSKGRCLFGAFTDMKHFIAQAFISDPASDQGCVDDDVLDEPVSCTAYDFFLYQALPAFCPDSF